MSLAELVVSLAAAALLFAATFTLVEQGQHAWAAGAARAETLQTARAALTRLVADVRTAGFGGQGFPAVAMAERERVVLQLDLDGDGVIAAPGERITWRLAGTVLRRDAGGGAQPIANGVRSLELAYLDANGVTTATADAVRSISVTLTVEPPRAVTGTPGASTLSTRVRLRNR